VTLDASDFHHIITVSLEALREGRFQRSLAVIAGVAALISGLEVTQEHYRGSYGQKVMYSPIVCCLLLAITAIFGAFNTDIARNYLPWVSALLILDGVIGFGFHIRGIARKPGGWRRNLVNNIVMGPPLFAPLLLGLGGFLGIMASRLSPEEAASALSATQLEILRQCFAGAAALSALLNGFEALYSHYKSRFSSRSQWIPICLAPPLVIIATLDIFFPEQNRWALGVLSLLAILAGSIGAGFHVNGILKRPGGMKNIFYNIVYGPPPFAPLLFAATGFLGLLAIQIGRPS